MAQRFLTSINLSQNELQNARIQNLGANPSAPVEGQVYYNTASKAILLYNGSAWINIAGDVTDVIAGEGLTRIVSGGDITLDVGAGNGLITHADYIEVRSDTTNDFQFNAGVLALKDIITAGSVGSSTAIPVLTYDANGRITAVSSAPISTSLSVAGDLNDGGDMNIDLATETLTIQGTANEIEVVAGYNNTDSLMKIGLPSNVTVSNNLTVQGDLIVSGTTTTVNTETINLADNIILLNSNLTTLPSQNAGIEVERGSLNNVELIWNETDDAWQIEVDPVNSTYENIATEDYVDAHRFNATITGDASTASFGITHGLNTRDVIVQIYDLSTYDTVYADTVRTSTTEVTITFATAPAVGEDYKVLVIKA
jgi:hypothetical protein